MKHRTHQSVLTGALILMLSTLTVKVIGMFFKIPLTQILGGAGMGYFMTAYGLFNPLYTLSLAGLPIAVSKMVSENMARGRYRDVKRIFHLAMGLFLAAGLTGTVLMAAGSRLFAHAVGNPQAVFSIVVLAPAVFFCCVTSAFRGYYEGLRNMVPTALSQVAEAVVKLLAGVSLALWTARTGYHQFAAGGAVFGQTVRTLEEAAQVILPAASAAAIGGVVLSTAAGALFLMARHFLRGDGLTQEKLHGAPAPDAARELLRQLIALAVPVCLASAAMNLTGIIDLFSLMNRLTGAVSRGAQAVLASHRGLIPAGLALEELPNYLYGCYSGLAMTLYNLVPSLTTAFAVSALPAVSSAWALRDRERTRRNVEAVLHLAAMIAIPAGIGISVLSHPLLLLLFGARPEEAAIAAPMLRVMGIAAVFAALLIPVTSMLQAVGRADLPVRLVVLGGAVKLACNYLLVGIPSLNILGAPYGSVLCYFLLLILSLTALFSITGVPVRFGQIFGKPLLAGLFCGAAAWSVSGLLSRAFSPVLSVPAAVAAGALSYAVVLLLLKGVRREDLEMVPGGEKIVKRLEKHNLLG